MFTLNTIKPNAWSRKKFKRLGRGNASGKWTYCTRGCKGQNSRSGGWVPAWFEWGQTPLFRRLPKLKGFSNALFKKHYNIINLSDLENLASKGIKEVNKEILAENGLLSKKTLDVKLLGKGELKSKVNIVLSKASKTAIEAVEKAWGKVELV